MKQVHIVTESFDSDRERQAINYEQNGAFIMFIVGFSFIGIPGYILFSYEVPSKYYISLILLILMGIFAMYFGIKINKLANRKEETRRRREWK